jgi:hypothetical protein
MNQQLDQSHGPNQPWPGHEETDADVKPIVIFLVGLGLFLALAMVAMSWLFEFFEPSPERAGKIPAGLTDSAQIPPEPRLQANPSLDLERLRAREENLLERYEWVDKTTGVMRIPLKRAMEIIAESGLPSRAASSDGKTSLGGEQ